LAVAADLATVLIFAFLGAAAAAVQICLVLIPEFVAAACWLALAFAANDAVAISRLFANLAHFARHAAVAAAVEVGFATVGQAVFARRRAAQSARTLTTVAVGSAAAVLAYRAALTALLTTAILVTFVGVLELVGAAFCLAKAVHASAAAAVFLAAAALAHGASIAAGEHAAVFACLVAVALAVLAAGLHRSRAGATDALLTPVGAVLGERTGREPGKAK